MMTTAELRKIRRQYNLLKAIRKPTLPPPHVFGSKKAYNRKDKGWKNEV